MTNKNGSLGGAIQQNPWEDPSSFHTKTREETSVPVSVRMPTGITREVQKIVQSGKYPGLETNTDVYRDALWRWVRWMSTVTPDPKAAMDLDLMRSRMRLEAMLARQEGIMAAIEAAEKILEHPLSEDTHRQSSVEELSQLVTEVNNPEVRRRILELVTKYR